MKVTINEDTLRNIVAESIKRILSEAKKGYTSVFDKEYWGVNDFKNGGKFKCAMRDKKIANTGKPIGNWQASKEDASKSYWDYKEDRHNRKK